MLTPEHSPKRGSDDDNNPPLLRNFLALGDESFDEVQDVFGGLAGEVIRRSGRLVIDTSGVTIEADGRVVKLAPTNGPDPETASLLRWDAQRMNSRRFTDALDTLIAEVRIILSYESNRRGL